VPDTRPRTISGVTGHALLGVLVALILGAAVLVVLAFYAGLEFGLVEVVVAVLVAGGIVALWTRWR